MKKLLSFFVLLAIVFTACAKPVGENMETGIDGYTIFISEIVEIEDFSLPDGTLNTKVYRDNNEKPVKQEHFEEGVLTGTTYMEFDKNGRVFKELFINADKEIGTLISLREFTYFDDSVNIAKQLVVVSDGKDIIKNEHTYDENGNLLESIDLSDK